MKKWWRRVRPIVLSRLAYWFVRTLGATFRIKVINFESTAALEGGKVYCCWHGRSMIASIKYRNGGHWVIISKSKDGDIQTHVFENFGFNVIRGSSGRGGERALIESIRVLRKGEIMAITPDGPRGPSQVVQGGVMVMARKSGAWLVPCAIAARPRFLAKSWDSYMIPFPFAKCIMNFGEAMKVPEDASEEAVETIRLAFQEEMTRLQEEAERMLGFAVKS
ncbi:MAG: lysophospholipid acyltransferase family protein [Chlorobia bacterium]|nr:lysophospholipid acyltransferase family protein [Fimbriimonadaceae bacterium]